MKRLISPIALVMNLINLSAAQGAVESEPAAFQFQARREIASLVTCPLAQAEFAQVSRESKAQYAALHAQTVIELAKVLEAKEIDHSTE